MYRARAKGPLIKELGTEITAWIESAKYIWGFNKG